MLKLLDAPASQGWAIAILRLVVGVVFSAHGWKKFFVDGVGGFSTFLGQLGIPAPGLFGPVVAGLELLGGLLLMFGLFTRWVTIPLAANMLVAAATVHLKNGFFLPAGFEYTLVLFAANVSLFLAGPGAFALDNLVAARTKKTPSSQPVAAQAN